MMSDLQQQNQKTLPRLANGEIRFARGWFCIGASEEFANGEIKAIKYFAQELVAFRTDSGNLVVLDAHCIKSGCHLGFGGQVRGESICCPYQSWSYNQQGQCFSLKMPESEGLSQFSAHIKSWQIIERSGVAFIWHDPEGNPAHYDIPEMAEYGRPGWTDWNLQRLELNTHQREIIENVADSAHFEVVHQMTALSHFENSYDAHTVTQTMQGKGPSGGGVKTTATYYGPAFQYTWMKAITETRLINTNTPIDEHTVHLWFGVMIQIDGFTEENMHDIQLNLEKLGYGSGFDLSPDNLKYVQDAIIDANRKGYYDDVAIWEHKLFRPRPILCDGDGPLFKLRQWYDQFYQDRRVSSS